MTEHASTETDQPHAQRREETRRLFEQAATTNGIEREELIEQAILVNIELARAMGRRYAGRGVPEDDLEQVACLALVRAAHRFDPSRADDFLVFAVPAIRGEIRRWFRDRAWMIRPTRSVQELQTAVVAHLHTRTEQADRSPAAIARALGVEEREVAEALTINGCFAPSSLDAPAGADGSGGSLGDLIPSYDDELVGIEVRLALERAMHSLSKRERLIVRLRFSEDMTQAEIGEVIGVTQMQVSRILRKVLTRLREVLTDDPMARGETWVL